MTRWLAYLDECWVVLEVDEQLNPGRIIMQVPSSVPEKPRAATVWRPEPGTPGIDYAVFDPASDADIFRGFTWHGVRLHLRGWATPYCMDRYGKTGPGPWLSVSFDSPDLRQAAERFSREVLGRAYDGNAMGFTDDAFIALSRLGFSRPDISIGQGVVHLNDLELYHDPLPQATGYG